MIYRASNKRKSEWCKFALATQQFSILDSNNKVICKRDVFDALYDENKDTQSNLSLLIYDTHQTYHLARRDGYNQSELDKQFIDEATREVMAVRALSLARRMNISQHFDHTIKWMAEAMLDIYENYPTVSEAINEKLKQ